MSAQIMAVALTLAVVLLLLYALLYRKRPAPAAVPLPLNEMEQACLETLTGVVAGEYRIISRVPVASLDRRRDTATAGDGFVDFTLYDAASGETVAAIWLQQPGNSEHAAQRRRIERAGIPVILLQRKTSYSILEIRRLLEPLLKRPPPTPDDMVATISMEALHICPHCQSRMHIKRAHSGSQKGTLFWVCEQYPACHHVEHYID